MRIIGVCFGHQIIGRAMGVKVAPSNRGWEVSVCPMELTGRGKELFQKDEVVSVTVFPVISRSEWEEIRATTP